jgi:hypothetical protein
MLAPNDLAAYIADHHGSCDRDKPKRNDCYWGKDATGRYNGCLKVGWLGRACPHWHPVSATSWEELISEEPQRDSMRLGHAFALIAMGFGFALIGIGNIAISLERHTPISAPLQRLCLTFFRPSSCRVWLW